MAVAKKVSNTELASIKERFLAWFANSTQRELNILITGKTGVGKSRLVNAFVGRPVAKEGREKSPCTTDINPYRIVIFGVVVVVWDSPGLQDRIDNDELYLANLKDKLKHGFDIMIYCIKMDDKRFHSEDSTAMQKLTTLFGSDLWKKSVIALTFANKIEDPDEEDHVQYFINDKTFWAMEILKFLQTELRVDPKVCDALPIVPVGNYKKLQLPTCDNWLAGLWLKCYNVMSLSAGLALYKINKNRLKFSCSDEMAVVSSFQPKNDQALPSGCESESHEDVDDSGNIPREIPLNKEQEDTFLTKIWKGFLRFIARPLEFIFSDLIRDLATRAFRGSLPKSK